MKIWTAAIAGTALLVMSSVGVRSSDAQDFDPSPCIESCQAEHDRCIEACGEHANPDECDASCRDRVEDCEDECG